MQDWRNGNRFLVDTGDEFSILPASPHDRRGSSPSEALLAANGTQVPVFGRRNVSLSLGTRVFSHEFLVADVTKPLLGVDFFNKFNIGIDTRAVSYTHLTLPTIYPV